MNRKGYVLVEIILAAVITFGIVYFITNLTIKLKNKNDDLLVETMVETDRSIIANKLMGYIYSEKSGFNCSLLNINNKKITYNSNTIVIVNEYTTLGSITCTNGTSNIYVKIPMEVKQMPDKDFDIELYYKK